MKIGFVGLGIMGRPMALHLAAAGHTLVVYGERRVSADVRATGALVVNELAEVARRSDAVILMLPNTQDVESALFARAGVAAGLAPGQLVIDMSSISPTATKDFASRINALSCDYLDAPVSGGEVGAENASLSIMVGGTSEAFERARPLFEKLGKNITLVGANGDGQTTKVANQIIVALTIEAVGEALLFASKAGADPARVRAALMGGFAASRVLEVHGERMVQRNFEPGFRIDLHHKDSELALAGAAALGLSLPNTAGTQQLFNAARAMDGGSWDRSGVMRVLEKLGSHSIA